MSASLRKKAIRAIEERGVILVYPLKEKPEIPSLWANLYPRVPMVWEWTEDADERVNELWILREELSRSREVVYAKWFQGRATFFSKEIFVQMVSALESIKSSPKLQVAQEILEILRSNSPLSTKDLKSESGLAGRLLESTFHRATRELWRGLWIVGFGEVEDSSFPSLNYGSTELLFEDLWSEAKKISSTSALTSLEGRLGSESAFFRSLLKWRRT